MTSTEPKWLKPATDFGPLAVFLIVYLSAGLMPATAALVIATVAALILSLTVAGRVPLMPLITAAIVVVFGGLSLIFADETFIKIKPTIIEGLFGLVLLVGYLLDKPLLKFVMGQVWNIDEATWRRLGLRFALFFFAMAALNEIIWRNFDTDTWVTFKVFGIIGCTFLFIMSQTPMIMRNTLPTEGDKQEGPKA